MSTPVILVRSPDRYVITEAEIKADRSANQGLPDTAEARRGRSDEVSSKLVGLYSGREPWRNTYSEVLSELDNDGKHIRLSRYPIEEVPEVWLGDSPIERGFYRLAGCPHFLVRNDHWIRSGHCWRWSTNGHRYRVPSYVAGYVPPGSIDGIWSPATAYVPGHSTALGDPKGSWVRSSKSAGQLLFENTSAGISGGGEPDFPLSLATWSPGFAYSDRWVNPTSSEFVFEPTTPGTSDPEEEPVWTDAEVAGDTVTDGDTLVWTARVEMSIPDAATTWTGRNAKPFPEIIRKAALLMARIFAEIDEDGACDHEKQMEMIIGLLQGEC